MGALDGVKVIEVGLHVQGPQAAATLLEWGAEVVKVELPGFGDQSRWLPLAADDFRSAFFVACNRGKRSVTADLRMPAGREVFLRLVEHADVVISNFRPGTMEGWGLGYDDLAARNPSVVVATGSTFGTHGPDDGREGADLSGQAAGGLISATGRPGTDPTPTGAPVADHIGALNLVAGILAALLHRTTSGRGQAVATSLVGSQIWAQAAEYTALLLTGRPAGRANRSNALIPGIYGMFPTADGWIAVVGIVGPARATFFETVGRPELADEFPETFYFAEEKAKLFPELDKAFSTETTDTWCQRLGAAGLRYAPVRDHTQVVADPAAWANGFFRTVEGPAGPVDVVAAGVEFAATPATSPAFAPELGQHTEEVLVEVGYSWEEITGLRDAGAI